MHDHFSSSLPLAQEAASPARIPATFAATAPMSDARLPHRSDPLQLFSGRTVSYTAQHPQTTSSSVAQTVTAPISGGDVLVAGSGILGTLLLIAATAAIAVKQGRLVLVDSRSREADRAERRADRERRARQDAWRDEYDSIRELLNHAETMVYEIVENGPHTSEKLHQFGAAKLALRARQLADRGLPALSAALVKLSGTAQDLAQAGMPDPREIEAAWRAGRNAQAPAHLMPVAVQRQAVRQTRLAEDLRTQLRDTRDALRTEWGGTS